jgi:hypothetical protein
MLEEKASLVALHDGDDDLLVSLIFEQIIYQHLESTNPAASFKSNRLIVSS